MRHKHMYDVFEKYAYSIEEFERCNYDSAVRTWIDIFSSDTTDEYREEIINNIYSCFVLPNDCEFRETFLKANVKCRYEDLVIDFIPINNESFYYFNKENRSFGYINLSGIQKRNSNICSICLINPSSIEVVAESVRLFDWDSIYIIDSNKNNVWKSLYKLPLISDVMREKVIILNSSADFENLLRGDSTKYLPQIIIGEEKEVYQEIVNNIHHDRITDSSKSNSRPPFLSVYIPSYNRGDSAYEAVVRALETNFDTEIEVVISNNGSKKTEESYKKIGEIVDSRLTYVQQPINKEYLGNIIQGFELCRGDYILFLSDEDRLCPSQMMELMNYLQNNREAGAYYPSQDRQIQNPVDIIDVSICATYLSGTIFNREAVEKAGVTEFLSSNKENYYIRVYPHNFAALMACLGRQYNLYSIKTYDKGEEYAGETDGEVYPYARVENRIQLLDAFAEVLYIVCNDYTLYVQGLWNMMNLIVGMLHTTSHVFANKVDLFEYQEKFYVHLIKKFQEHRYHLLEQDMDRLIAMVDERIEACFSTDDERHAWNKFVSSVV